MFDVLALLHKTKSFKKCDRTDDIEGVPLKPSAEVYGCGRALRHLFNKDIGALVDQRLQLSYRRQGKTSCHRLFEVFVIGLVAGGKHVVQWLAIESHPVWYVEVRLLGRIDSATDH
jgi:hypothetical protein